MQSGKNKYYAGWIMDMHGGLTVARLLTGFGVVKLPQLVDCAG
jgi:hypothetical protein